MEDKRDKLIIKIGSLREKLFKINQDYLIKASKVTDQIRIIEEKILNLRVKMFNDKEILDEFKNDLGIDWIGAENEKAPVEISEEE